MRYDELISMLVVAAGGPAQVEEKAADIEQRPQKLRRVRRSGNELAGQQSRLIGVKQGSEGENDGNRDDGLDQNAHDNNGGGGLSLLSSLLNNFERRAGQHTFSYGE